MTKPAPVAKNRLHQLAVKRVDLVDRGAVRDPESPAEPQAYLMFKSERVGKMAAHPFMPGGEGGNCKICGKAKDDAQHDQPASKGEWSAAMVNDLPDSSFAAVEPGEKDGEGKTTPRSNRHLPYKGPDGKVDLPHLRNALSRLPQTDLSDDLKAEARKKLEAAASNAAVGDTNKQEEYPMFEKIKAQLEKAAEQEAPIAALLKGVPEEQSDAVVGAVRLLAGAGAALTPEVKAALNATFGIVKAAEPKADQSPEDVLKAELEKLPPALRQHIAAIEKKAADADDVAKSERKGRRMASLVALAKDEMSHVPGQSTEELAGSLYALEEALPEVAKTLTETLKSASKAIKEGVLLKELGSGGEGFKPDAATPAGQLQAKADELRKADPKLSPEQAIAKAADENPDLYAAHKTGQDRVRVGKNGTA